jgi:hypothetical protein
VCVRVYCTLLCLHVFSILYTYPCSYICERHIPTQTYYRPWCFQEAEFPRFQESAREGGKDVSPRHRPPLPPENIPGTHFCYRLSRFQVHSAAGRISSMKNYNDIIGNRTRDLSNCSAVPLSTAPPRAPHPICTKWHLVTHKSHNTHHVKLQPLHLSAPRCHLQEN